MKSSSPASRKKALSASASKPPKRPASKSVTKPEGKAAAKTAPSSPAKTPVKAAGSPARKKAATKPVGRPRINLALQGGGSHGAFTWGVIDRLLDEDGLGQSSAVGIGGDPINGLKHIDVMRAFNDDPDTDAVIMIGEIGGPDEAEAAQWCKANMKKPIVGFIAGVTAPPGKRMGHAGALISGGADTADAKLAIMEECGFKVTRNPSEMGRILKSLI